ncbi:hypothetical protein CC78DRAFT_587183 [Lojkania enalia]|uniref:Uncharacterized protein n=1 Tax=Lojkania enalia TaxID=147567 RepID=A0A9P4JWV1_9PLEO|nr:hypothetical protein CC78DRAFT_587183 [Didymosphaeria enalia]
MLPISVTPFREQVVLSLVIKQIISPVPAVPLFVVQLDNVYAGGLLLPMPERYLMNAGLIPGTAIVFGFTHSSSLKPAYALAYRTLCRPARGTELVPKVQG